MQIVLDIYADWRMIHSSTPAKLLTLLASRALKAGSQQPETKMTTAEYRKQAQAHEENLEWGYAIDAWQKAIDTYPTTGALAKKDIERMEARKQACKSMYFPA